MNRLTCIAVLSSFGISFITSASQAGNPPIYDVARSVVEYEIEQTAKVMERIQIRMEELEDEINRIQASLAFEGQNDKLRSLSSVNDRYVRKMRELTERQNLRMAQLEVILFSESADVHCKLSGTDGASTILRAVRYKGAIQLGGRTFVTLEGPEGRWQVEISNITAIEQKTESTTQPSSK